MADTPATVPAVTENESIAEPIADNPNPEIVSEPEPEPAPRAAADDDDDDDRPKAPPANPRNAKLAAIADRLKAERRGDDVPTADGGAPDFDLRPEFMREAEPPPEPAAAPEPTPEARASGPSDSPAPAAPPKRLKLKVDDQEFERDISEVARLADMTPEEVEANPERARRYAQKELASERRLDQAKEILRGANQRTHESRVPGAPNQEQAHDPSEPIPEPSADQPADPLEQLIEDIQFGTASKDAAIKLRAAVKQTAREETAAASIQQRMKDDFDVTMQAFEKLKTDNKELFADPNAHAVMERMLYDGYTQDLRTIGVPDERIPQNRQELADWHRFYRVKGHKVRQAEKLLNDVKTDYVAWRGGTKPGAPAPQPDPAPRNEDRVAVDRSQRRQAIPTQPTRASAPPSTPSAPKQRASVAEIRQQMRKARGQATAI
jgi:hypothetical protein